MMCALKFDKLE